MSFYDDAKTISLMSGAAGKDRKIYNVKPEEELASELLTNPSLEGDFTLDTNTHANGWVDTQYNTGTVTISNNRMTLSAVGDQTALAYAAKTSPSTTAVLTPGKSYRLQYTVVENNGTTEFYYYNNAIYTLAPHEVGTHYIRFDHPSPSTNDLFLFRNSGNDTSIVLENISVKEITTEAVDFNFYRGSNLTATRVGPDGLIEKGREQLLVNTVFAGLTTNGKPTNYNDSYTTGSGSLSPLASDSTKVKFEVTNASGGRFYLSETVSNTNLICTSVFVDEVTGTAPEIRQIVRSFSSNAGVTRTIIHAALKDGEVVSDTDTVVAGHRYAMVCSYDGSSVHRFGLGANQSFEAVGSVTLSQPQIEAGLTPTAYIKNTSTSATAEAGVLSDEPRFDYTGGGCPKLLMEPQRVNELPHSEYFTNSTYWQLLVGGTRTSNSATSPEGVLNATSLQSVGSEYNILRSVSLTLDTSTKYVFSFYAKNVDATNARYRVYDEDQNDDIVEATSYFSQLSTTEWKRIEVPFTTHSTSTNYNVYFASGNLGGEILLWGAQVEKGEFATSYIPTYGAAATRTIERKNSGSDIMIPGDAFDLTGDFSIMLDIGDFNFTRGSVPTNYALLFLKTGTSPERNFGFFLTPGSSSGDEGINVYFSNNGNYVFGTDSNDAPAGDSKMLVTYNATTDKLAYYINGNLLDSETRDLTMSSSVRGYFGAVNASDDGDEISFEINKIIFFDNDLSVNDSQILTGTSYTNFAAMASELSYTEYE